MRVRVRVRVGGVLVVDVDVLVVAVDVGAAGVGEEGAEALPEGGLLELPGRLGTRRGGALVPG